MSDHLASPMRVPESTVTLARSIFYRDNPYLQLFDTLTPVFLDERFAELFSGHEQPAEAPWRLSIVTMLQLTENLSDRQAADAVRSRIDWKYLLGLNLDDAGFDSLVLHEFRCRLVAKDVKVQLLDALLAIWRGRGLLIPIGQPPADITHVLTSVCAINRLTCVYEAMHAARDAFAGPTFKGHHFQDCFEAGPVWVEHFDRPIDNCQIPIGKAAKDAYATRLGRDALAVMDAILLRENPSSLREIPSLCLLKNLWFKNFLQTPAGYRVVSKSSAPKEAIEWVDWRETNDDFPRSLLRPGSPFSPSELYKLPNGPLD